MDDNLIKQYNKVSKKLKIKRKKYLWRWVIKAFKITTILSKKNKYYRESIKIKFFSVLLIILLDDIAENLQNKELLNVASKIVKEEFDYFTRNNNAKEKTVLANYNYFSIAELDYLSFVQKTTQEMLTNVSNLPNYNLLEKKFYRYWLKVINCFKFTLHVNKFVKENTESRIEKYFNNLSYSYYTNITGHNMHVILAMIIDLMSLPKINREKINLSIKISKEAQAMGRIDNWLSTWKRELIEKDFSNGVSIYSIKNKSISIKDVKTYISNSKKKKNNRAVIKLTKQIKKSNFINYFMEKWKKHREKIKQHLDGITIFSVDEYLKGADSFLKLHLDNENKI